MHPKTGRITRVKDDDEAKARGLVRLSNREATRLRKLPEPERPAKLLEMRALHPLAQLPGMTKDDVRKIRNQMKRERRLRLSA